MCLNSKYLITSMEFESKAEMTDYLECLSGGQFWRIYNLPFLQEALERGDRFIFASEIILDNIFNLIGLTGYGREIIYLLFYKIFEYLLCG